MGVVKTRKGDEKFFRTGGPEITGRKWDRSPGPSHKVSVAVLRMKIGVELRPGRTGGWSRPMRRKGNERKEIFGWEIQKLGKIVDWSKIILINFSPITNFFRLRFSSFPFPLSPTTRRSRRLSCRSHPILDERKKRSTHSEASRVAPPPPLLPMCPCVMSPFLSLSAMPVSLPDWRLHLKTRCGDPAVVSVTLQ